MPLKRLLILLCACVLIVASWVGTFSARHGLVIRSFTVNDLPMTWMAPEHGTQLPGVLVAHGFAGSKQLMYGYGYTLAQNGYGVLLWDFQGHAANTQPLVFDGLAPDFEQAYQTLLQRPEIDPTRVAVIGHSMGSGVVLDAAIATPDRFQATIGISPTGDNVTPEVPHNLQLQAGVWEAPLLDLAQDLLEQGGGPNPDTSEGRGRSLVAVPHVEHITILFSDRSHQAALAWLQQTFDLGDGNGYRDRRIAWYGLHLLAWVMLLGVVLPRSQHPVPQVPLRSWGGLLLAAPVAIATLSLTHQAINIDRLGGVLVAGALGFWLLMAGATWLSLIDRVPPPRIKSVVWGLLTFAGLWFGFGALAQVVWLQWTLVPARWLLWALLSLACLPWFLAAGLAQQNTSTGKRILWWLAQSGVIMVGLAVTILVLPQLGFVGLLLPLFPVFLGLLALIAAFLNDAWSYAIGSCLFFGVAIATSFPLVH